MFGFLKKKLSESVEKLSDKIKKREEEAPVERPVEMPKPPKVKKKIKPERKERVEKPSKEEPKIAEEKVEVKPEVAEEEKPTLKERVVGRVLERKVSGNDIDSLFEEIELGLMEANVAVETIDFLKDRMKEYLVDKQLRRGEIEREVKNTLENILVEIFDQGKINLEKLAKKKRPVSIVFLGFNGSGKTTSIAKLGKYLTNKRFKVVLAAGDTFRAASI
jgi:fused signal recognition particle receptor